jgi:hypothetical protein
MRVRIGFLIVGLVVIWLAVALVRVENQRYALQIGMCRDAKISAADLRCLDAVQTRTGWWWHLYFALKG